MAQSQYAQVADLQSLAITVAAGTRFGTAAMNAALQAASSIADSYIASEFTLPLQASPQGWDMSLTLHVSNMAAFMLYNQFGYSPGSPGDEMVQRRYDAAIEWLKQIREKKIFPQWTDSAPATGTDEAGAFILSDTAIGFTTRGVTGSDPDCPDPWGLDVGDDD